jgi:hypothetical protein
MFFICYQIAILYQFIIHTEVVPKLPWIIEFFFVTPSHHRVHHGTNKHYIDKNYGATFIIWDRLYGTFQEEDEKPVYGLTKPVNTFNPVTLVFHEWVDIFKDLRHAKSFREAYKILFYPPGAIITEKQKEKEQQQIEIKPEMPIDIKLAKQPVGFSKSRKRKN